MTNSKYHLVMIYLCSSVRISVVPIRSGSGKSWSNEPVANNDALRYSSAFIDNTYVFQV